MHQNRSGFTLIELLVVIAIVAVLAVVVVLVLNPAQLLQQSRDSSRLSDLATLNSSLGYYLTDSALSGSQSLGSANTVYVSIADPTATSTAGDQCQGLGLPTLPAIYTYHCAASSTFRLTNATGWIPVSFSTMSNGSPLGQLPIDPTNSTSSRLYYTYTTNGSQYEVTAAPESSKYKLGGASDAVAGDGAMLSTVYAKGSNLALEPLDYGDPALVGWWPINEGTGAVAYDWSGFNATGSWSGTQAGTSGYYSAGKVASWAGFFDGNTDSVNTGNDSALALNTGSSWSLSFWFSSSSSSAPASDFIVINGASGVNRFGVKWNGSGSSLSAYNGNYYTSAQSSFGVGAWYFITEVQNGNTLSLYINGVMDSSNSSNYTTAGAASPLGIGKFSTTYFNGLVNDVRIYSRALSAAEIQAMYNGGK